MELDSLSLADLRDLAKMRGLTNVSKLKKKELIELILEVTNNSSNPTEESEEKIEMKKEDINSEDGNYSVSTEGDEIVEGILEVLPDGYGFLRGKNYLPSQKDVYVSPIQIKRFRLDTGDKVKGIKRATVDGEKEKFPSLIFVGEVNDEAPEKAFKRVKFDDLIPIYPNKKLKLEASSKEYTMRLMDLFSPIGKDKEV